MATNAATSPVSIATSAHPRIWLSIYMTLPFVTPIALLALFCGVALFCLINVTLEIDRRHRWGRTPGHFIDVGDRIRPTTEVCAIMSYCLPGPHKPI